MNRSVLSLRLLLAITWLAQVLAVNSQTTYGVSASGTLSSGDHSPLWLNANRHGMSSVEKAWGLLRAHAEHHAEADSAGRVTLGYGVDAAVGGGMQSTLMLQQAYLEGRWIVFDAMIGAKELCPEMKDGSLSSGAQTLGINSRPIPQLRAGIPEYWPLPLTKGWVSLKGHLAYGFTTDDSWQKDFVANGQRHTDHTFFHSKFAAVKVGPGSINFELGLEMACQFGGRSYNVDGQTYENASGPRAFLDALMASGTDVNDGDYHNASGNHVGSWLVRLNIDRPTWALSLYGDQFFEDNSMMVHINYNGWGTGTEAFSHTKKRYFIYDFSDGLQGVELTLKNCAKLQKVVVEHLSTKYQGGPVYHDITARYAEHVCGRDDYYNHYLYTGWQHWGQVIGNPLYRSPLYNDDGIIDVRDNRFVAWHLGMKGSLFANTAYRLLASWQKGYGTYYKLLPDPQQNMSLMAELTYTLPDSHRLSGCYLTAALAADRGKLIGNNFGCQFTIGKNGIINKKGGRR